MTVCNLLLKVKRAEGVDACVPFSQLPIHVLFNVGHLCSVVEIVTNKSSRFRIRLLMELHIRI